MEMTPDEAVGICASRSVADDQYPHDDPLRVMGRRGGGGRSVTFAADIPSSYSSASPIILRALNSQIAGNYEREITGDMSPPPSQLSFTWYERAFLIPHEPIRRYCQFGAEFLVPRLFSAHHPRRCLLWFKWYNSFFFPILHHHHSLEDAVYFPWIVSRSSEPLPDTLVAEHWSLDAALHEIKILGYWMQKLSKELLMSAPSDLHVQHQFETLAQQLRDKWTALTDFLLNHMDQEELLLPPLLHSHCTEREEKSIVQKMGILGFFSGSNKLAIPGILLAMAEWGGEGQVHHFLSSLPPPIRIMALKLWIPQYQKKMQRFRRKMTQD